MTKSQSQIKREKVQQKPYSVKAKGGTMYLHEITTPRYYFAKSIGKNAVMALPKGFKVVKAKSGLPVLARV